MQTVTITVAEDSTGKSLRHAFDAEGRMQGSDLVVSLLPDGESYGNRIKLFTGKIDDVSWRAGVQPGEGVGTLVAVAEDLHRDITLPETILTTDLYPALPEPTQGAVLPLIYGNSAGLTLAPLLLIDPTTLLYRAADHGLGVMSTTHGVAGVGGTRLLELADAATATPADAALILTRPVTENRYLIPGVTRELTHLVDVTNPNNAFDGLAETVAEIGTISVNEHGDGRGRLAAKYTWPDPEGANTALVTLLTHRRNPGALNNTLVTASLIVRSLDPVTNAIQRDALFRSPDYRHASHVRTHELLISPLAIVTPAALEVELEVLNEIGSGDVTDVWYLGELGLLLYFQADTLFYPIYLVGTWEGRPDADGSITGVVGGTILHAVDVIHSVLRDRLGLTVNPVAFPATRAALTTYLAGLYRFDFGLGGGGWSQQQLSGSQLLDTLALQATCYLFPSGDGSVAIARSRDVMVSEAELTVSNMWNVEVDLGRTELIHSTVEVRYAWSVLQQRYAKVALATPERCNHPDSVRATDLFTYCNDSWQRYGPQKPLLLDGYAIQDDATAFTLLEHLVRYHWTQQAVVTCDIPYLGIHLEVGDYVTITHPELTANENAQLFEIVRLTHRPDVPGTQTLPIQLVALRTVLTTFDYFAVMDQDGVTWFWWVDRAGDLDWALTPPTIITRVAHNLDLSPTPSWFEVTDPDGATRYIFPRTLTGAPDVTDTEPANGTGQVGSPTVRGMGLHQWYLDVTRVYEVLVRQVRPVFDYFAINDQASVPWYWWINPAGELVWGLSPPSLDARVAEDLNLVPTPYWLHLDSWYVYPSSTTGEPLSASTPPAVGTGYEGSPTLRSSGTGSWILDVTVVGEIVTVPA